MKTFFLLIAFLLSSILSTQTFGQVQLTNSVFPTVGDTLTYFKGITSGIFEGDSGPNATWDFSSLQPQAGSTETTRIYLNPAGTPYEGQFLNSNLCYKDIGTSTLYTYLKKETNKLTRLGTASTSSTRKFSNTDEFFKTPLNLLGQFNDSYVATITSNIGNPIYQYGNYTIEYDAYGALILPQGYFNAYRLKTEENRVDSIIQQIGYCEVSYVAIMRYTWYIPHVPDLALTIAYTSGIRKIYDNCTGVPTISNLTPTKSVTYRGDNIDILSGSGSIEFVEKLALNSASFNQDNLRISVNSPDVQDCSIKVLSIEGKLIFEDKISLTEGESHMNYYLPTLSNGTYILSLNSNGTTIGKIVVNAKYR